MFRKINCSALVALVVLAVALSGTASAGLVGHWTFDETSGSTAKDSSGLGNNGTVIGTPKWVPGKIGGALEFNGSTYVDCGNKASLNVRNQITMSFWFKVKAFTNTWESFLAKGDGAYRSARSGGTGNATHMGISGGNYFDGVTIITDDHGITGPASTTGPRRRFILTGSRMPQGPIAARSATAAAIACTSVRTRRPQGVSCTACSMMSGSTTAR